MAERRMFAKTIIDSDAFLDMPVTARLLYYDLSMRADDDGFINSPKKIMRMVGASQDDLSILIAKKFIIPFDNGIVVIKHWRIHNYIRKDTYKETPYKEQKALLKLDENNAYKLSEEVRKEVREEVRQLPVDEPSTQDRLGKDRLGKDRLGKDRLDKEVVVVDAPEDEPKEKWLSNRLTDEQWKKLDSLYHNLIGLIDYVDNQVDDVTEIKNPFKYIIAIADKKNWDRKT